MNIEVQRSKLLHTAVTWNYGIVGYSPSLYNVYSWYSFQSIIIVYIYNNIVPLAAPPNLRKRELQDRRITLQWDELSVSERAGPQNTFSLNVSANPLSDSGCLQQHVYHTTDTYISIDNLCPNTLYTISVRACNSPLPCGPYSPTIQVQTLEGGKCTI